MKRLPDRLCPPRDAGDEVRDEVREEIRFYLEERARELEAQGMAPEEARSAAREAFGDPDAVAARLRSDDARHRRSEERRIMMDGLTKDLALAVRGLARRPGFTAVLVLTLGLGIGAVTAVFSVVNASLLSALPFQDAERLVFLQGAFDAPEGPQVRGASPAEARDWETMGRSFQEVAAFEGVPYTVTGTEGDAERGVAVCGSGAGVSVAASKLPGIRAATCHDHYTAAQCVSHDDCNVLCLGTRVVGSAVAAELVVAFADAAFSGEER
ncbi:MAG: RpiB/LacA/LacB family sugar-phosphate isomerase, partial [Gemmatimonadetes bacterium]|nr:RpiB/LacA/LacB family sugar-phosphate isomerase [Gemmatimonadota bacterium]